MDAGRDAGVVDAGVVDAGMKVDAGPPFRHGYADEPCPDAGYDFEGPDGGFPEGTVMRGLCIAVTTLNGTATLDGQPVTEPIHIRFDGFEYGADLDVPADSAGNYTVRVMRSRYDRLLYHPNEVLDHAGPKDFGVIDMRKDQSRDLSVKTWIVTGAAFYAGQPWPSSSNPPDTTITTEGLQSQSSWSTNVGGTYQVRLFEGQFAYKVSVPFESLGETELMRFPVQPYVDLNGDKTIDINIPTSELSGNFTIDGQPLADRLSNMSEYRLQYIPTGKTEPIAATVHEGGASFYSAIVPSGTYKVNLELHDAADPSLPAILYNLEFARQVDLTANQQLDVDLKTFKVEGALLIDGIPVAPKQGYAWTMYAYSLTLPTQPWFVAYYRVPLTTSSFTLRALGGEYFLYLYLDSNLGAQLAEGWYLVDRERSIFADTTLPIDIPTHVLTGTLLIDGVPAKSTTGNVGTLIFESNDGYFRHKFATTDGTFTVRLPRQKYNVHFEIDPDAYPDYAVGREFLDATVDLTQPSQPVTLDYKTIPVAGPLLFDGEVLQDTLSAQPEVSLSLRPTNAWGSFRMALNGGRPWYFLRIPKNNYKMTFELRRDAVPDIAYGTAPIGNDLLLDVR